MASARLNADERRKFSLRQRGLGAVNAVSESGLYALIMRSDKPSETLGLQDHGTLGFQGPKSTGGRPARAYYLNDGQATLVCMFSRTKN